MRTDRVLRTTPGYRRVGRPARKSELDYNFALGDGIELLHPDHWDAVTGARSLFMQRDFCRIMEVEGPRALKSRYGIVYRKEEPVAVVAARIAPLRDQMAQLDGRPARRPQSYRILSNSAELSTDVEWQAPARSLMFCGDFYAGGFHGIQVREGEDLGKLWPAIVTLLQKIQVQEGLTRDKDYLFIKDVPTMPASDTRLLRHQQFRKFETSPNMVFELSPRWTSYEDYLGQLNVRYRLVAHRAARELYKNKVETRPLTDLAPWARRMHELYAMVQRKSGINYLPLPKDFLPALAQQLDPSLIRCSAQFQGDEMLGFVLMLRDRDSAYCYATGWDASLIPSLPLLPSLLHTVIENAIDMGCRRINFGRTALRMKAQLGAHPEQTELWIQHTRPELGLSVSTILETLSHAPSGDVASPLPV